MPRGQRSPDFTQISISMPKSLLTEIDEEAAADNRSRSNWIVTELRAAVQERRAAGARPSSDSKAPIEKKIQAVLCPPPGSLRRQSDPAEAAHTTNLHGDSTRSLESDEESLAKVAEEPKAKTKAVGPRARSTRPGIRKVVSHKPEEKL